MTLTSAMTIDEVAGTAQLIDNIAGNGTFTYNYAGGRVTIPESIAVSSYSFEDFKAHLNSLNYWKRCMQQVINPPLGELVSHEYERESEIDTDTVMLKGIIDTVEFNADYAYSSDVVTFQPCATLDMSWITFQEYLKMLSRFSTAIDLLRFIKSQEPA